MNRKVALTVLVAGFVAATSPVWAAGAGNPTFMPNPAYVGQKVSFSGSGSVSKLSGSCDVTAAAGAALTYSCTYDVTGRFSGWVLLPTTVTPGMPYVLAFCAPVGCNQKTWIWGVTNAVGVTTSPPPPSAIVPNLRCMDYASASKGLSGASLVGGGGRFPGGVVGSETPNADATVSPGSTVTLYPVRVPTLEGISYAVAVRRIAAACATPVRFGPPDGLVTSQSPLQGDLLPVDRSVYVYLPRSATTITPTPTTPTTSSSTSPASSSSSASSSATLPTSPTSSHSGGHTSGPPHRPWWRRAALPTGSLVGLAALALVGLHEWRIHRPPTPMALGAELRFRNPRDPSDWASTRPGRVTPSFVLRLHTSYQWREPS